MTESDISPILAAEQDHLDRVYARLDRMRHNSQRRLGQALTESDGTPQAQSARESYERLYTDELTRIDAAEHNLYFGRLDLADGEVRRLGRIGILNDDDHDTTLLLDWRAPLARPFYLATPAAPDDVIIRRHLRTRNRRVTEFHDENLVSGEATAAGGDVVNEAALLSALQAARTGVMTDIVETIQREQDEIIRSPGRGVLVVQGGPGTGKTAVALHRAAYLLYTHRDMLSRSGVLIIGPGDTFLRYIGQVLPSLGENGVVLSTVGNLYPGVRASVTESALATRTKGLLAMVDVLRLAIRNSQRVPTTTVTTTFDSYPLDITAKIVQRARGRARSSRRPHNDARPLFLRTAVEELANQHAARIGSNVLDGTSLLSRAEIADIRDELLDDERVLSALDEFWPTHTPIDFLRRFLADPDAIADACPQFDDQQRKSLHRNSSEFSAADAPLLDELAELIGVDTEADARRRDAQWRQQLEQAQDALDILSGSAPQDIDDELDPELLMAYDVVDAEQLAQRQTVREHLTTAERAHGDRTWAFGHVIVDEAQELSAMDWRMIMRRIPNRWMTIIGDTAQTGSPAGTSSWGEALEPYVAQRWRRCDLTVNYRTPAEIMAVASAVLKQYDPQASAPQSLRRSGNAPRAVRTESDQLLRCAHQLAATTGGVAGIIVPDALAPRSAESHDVAVLTVAEVKGLEYDRVVVVEPAAIAEQSERGLADLYVALTRSTSELVLVHSEELPDYLAAALNPT